MRRPIAILAVIAIAAAVWLRPSGSDEPDASATGAEDRTPSSAARRAPARPSLGTRAVTSDRDEIVTREGLVGDVRTYGNSGHMPDHKAWIWKAHKLLREEPALCQELAQPFLAGELNRNGRALVMDVLAAAGTPEAQAVMRQLLDSDQARADPAEHMLLTQRFTFVRRPAAESMAYLRAMLEQGEASSDINLEKAALYSIGAGVGHAERAGTPGLATDYERDLRARLEADRGPRRRSWALEGLGNTKLDRNVPAIVDHRSDRSWEVRRAVASALRTTETAEGIEALVELAADRHKEVQRRAFRSLRGKSVDSRQLASIADALEEGRIQPMAYPTLLRFAAELDRPAAAALLRISRYLAVRAPDSTLRMKARKLGARANL